MIRTLVNLLRPTLLIRIHCSRTRIATLSPKFTRIIMASVIPQQSTPIGYIFTVLHYIDIRKESTVEIYIAMHTSVCSAYTMASRSYFVSLIYLVVVLISVACLHTVKSLRSVYILPNILYNFVHFEYYMFKCMFVTSICCTSLLVPSQVLLCLSFYNEKMHFHNV
jgi:hypothetical protein